MTRTAVVVGTLILGLGFLGGVSYVWVEHDLAHYGQATYTITGTGAPT